MTDPTPQDAPDATADRATLLAWYRDVVQTFAATHHYEAFRELCHWCLADEQQFRARSAGRSDTVKYCSTRCVDAADAYRTKVMRDGKTTAPAAENTAEADVEPAEPAQSVEAVAGHGGELVTDA